jgi:hypothetical protein
MPSKASSWPRAGSRSSALTWPSLQPTACKARGSSGADLPIFPGGLDPFANDVIPQAAKEWQADAVITLKDSFVFKPEAVQGLRFLPMVPIDHDPIPPSVTAIVRHALRPIAYAQHGYRALHDAGFDPRYAPHAYDPKVYYPMDKAEARKALGISRRHSSSARSRSIAAGCPRAKPGTRTSARSRCSRGRTPMRTISSTPTLPTMGARAACRCARSRPSTALPIAWCSAIRASTATAASLKSTCARTTQAWMS